MQLIPYPEKRSTMISPLTLGEPLDSAFRRSCFDCHAREKPRPWYGRVAPMSWWIGKETSRALAAIDFSSWNDYTPRQQQLILERSLIRVRHGTMPPLPYHLAHPSLSPAETEALEAHLESYLKTPDGLQWSELTAWPSLPWDKGPVRQVVTTGEIQLERPLVMEGGMLICQGDLTALAGVTGHGIILVKGTLTLAGLQGEPGPLALCATEGTVLKSPSRCTLSGYVGSRDKLKAEGVRLETRPGLVLPVPGVKEKVAYFCRDDGQLGEFAERCLVIRYQAGQYVLWDPELGMVQKAATLSQALAEVESLLGRDFTTNLAVWRKRYSADWKEALTELARDGLPAKFTPETSIPPQAPQATLVSKPRP